MSAIRAIEIAVAVGMLASAVHGIMTGRMRVKGAGEYVRAENPRGFRFMVVTHVIAAAVFAGMAWMGIPP